MSRKQVSLFTPQGKSSFQPTGGFLYSVEATLSEGATTAVVDVFVSNSAHGKGLRLATIELTVDASSDGFSVPAEDQGWMFVRAEQASGDDLKSVTACVAKEA